MRKIELFIINIIMYVLDYASYYLIMAHNYLSEKYNKKRLLIRL